MIRLIQTGVVLGVSVLLTGCGGAPPLSPEEQGKDYRQMVQRTRDRVAASDSMYLVQDKIQEFQTAHGRLPEGLQELVMLGFLDRIPPAPEGSQYAYDRILGNVQLVKQQEGRAPPVAPPPPQN